MKIKVTELECKKCGWRWIARKVDVRVCPNPKCQTRKWDTYVKKGK